MNNRVLALCLLLGLIVVVQASPAKLDDLEEQHQSRSGRDDDDDDDEKRPYSFAWEASRHYHGAPDREHREERGPDGITRGVFRYVDPSLRVQEVIYTADDNGFHVENTNEPEYTEAQIAERERHAQLFQQIAEEHSKIGSEHALRAAELGYEPQTYDAPVQVEYPDGNVDPASLPQFTPVLEKARNLHQDLFERIRAQHARIAAERKTDPAEEETGEPYEYQYDTPLKTVEVVSGSVGPSLLARTASVVAPGEDHPDFQGYGVPLGTFRDDITEEEALMLLMQADAAHIERFQSEADLHEALVLEGPGAVAALRARLNQAGLPRPTDASGGFRQGVSGSTKSLSSQGTGNRHQGSVNAGGMNRRKANAFQSQAASSTHSKNRGSQGHSQSSRTEYASHQQSQGAGSQSSGANQGTGVSTHSEVAGTGSQYSAGSQGSQGVSTSGQFNAANQGTTTGTQYTAGNRGASNTGHNNNLPAASVRQSAPGHQGFQANEHSSGNKVSAHDSSAHDHSSPHQHSVSSSAGTGKFSAGSQANSNRNTGGAKFNQGTAPANRNQAKLTSFGGVNKQPSVGQHNSGNAGQSHYSANAGQTQHAANAGQSQFSANAGQPQHAANAGESQFSANAGQPQHAANAGQSQFSVNAGQSQLSANAGQSQFSANAGQSQFSANAGQPQHAANAGLSQFSANAGQSQHTANARQSQFSANAGHRQTKPSHRQSAVGGQQQNLQHQFNVAAGQGQASNSGRNQYSNAGRGQGHVGQGTTNFRQAGTDVHYDNADQEAALAIIAEQRDNHLRQFRKIAQAHEAIGDEHHQLTLAALQKQRMKIQAW